MCIATPDYGYMALGHVHATFCICRINSFAAAFLWRGTKLPRSARFEFVWPGGQSTEKGGHRSSIMVPHVRTA